MSKLSSLIEEVKRYEAARARERRCFISTVQPVTDWVRNGIPHAGVATHICMAVKDHVGNCQCECGHKWKGKK